MGATKLLTAAGGGITLDAASTATDKTITIPADNGTLVYANSSGNVGIGTSSPASKLQVGSTADSNTILTVASANNTTAGIDLMGDLDGAKGFRVKYEGNGNYFAIQDNTSGTLTERARIDSSGNLLVGTTSDSIGAKVGITSSTNSLHVVTTASGSVAGSFERNNAGILINWRNNGSDISGAYIYNNTTSVSYATGSDYRLKENIAPMTGALSVVQALKPCTYTWKADGAAGQGFIAHELQEFVPECVIGEKDAVDADGKPVYQGVDTSFLVATLTAAIQELKAELDAAKADIAALKGTQ